MVPNSEEAAQLSGESLSKAGFFNSMVGPLPSADIGHGLPSSYSIISASFPSKS